MILPCRKPHPFFPQQVGFLQNTKPACFPASCAIHLVFSRHKEQCWIPLCPAALLCALLGPGAGQSSREELLAVLEMDGLCLQTCSASKRSQLTGNGPSYWISAIDPLPSTVPLFLSSILGCLGFSCQAAGAAWLGHPWVAAPSGGRGDAVRGAGWFGSIVPAFCEWNSFFKKNN